jgi:hypothetical protein
VLAYLAQREADSLEVAAWTGVMLHRVTHALRSFVAVLWKRIIAQYCGEVQMPCNVRILRTPLLTEQGYRHDKLRATRRVHAMLAMLMRKRNLAMSDVEARERL